MSQNISTAVMQRRIEPSTGLDDFPSPPWATRALCEAIAPRCRQPLGHLTVREPCANRGHMARPLGEYFGAVDAADIFDYGAGYPVQDYLFGPDPDPVDWSVTNPPFRLAEQFIERALDTSRVGTAIFARTALLEGVGRFQRVFSKRPPTLILQFSERVVLHKGKLSEKGSTATSYAWFLWEKDWLGTRFGWIPPCRKRLERKADYEVNA